MISSSSVSQTCPQKKEAGSWRTFIDHVAMNGKKFSHQTASFSPYGCECVFG
jgi:hypothetical protein